MKTPLSILIIEDDKYARLHLLEILRPFGVIEEAADLSSARNKLAQNIYDIVITDIELGDGSGTELIPLIAQKGSYCIVVSSFEGDETVENSYQLGARHYLSKFQLKDQLPVYIRKFIQSKNSLLERYLKEEFITQDQSLIDELNRLSQINWKNQSLLITGQTGTGKSLLGKFIHEMTHPEAQLVHLNCSEISESLLESELFGHEKGAFTGAAIKKEGKLKLAHGGTLFLDEVGTMPMSMQQKLLKALDEKTFYPVGSSVPVRSEFTLITATCENLKEKIKAKEFREDLFYRISGFQFHMKPLHERTIDIDLIIKNYQKKCPRRFVIKPEAVANLISYSWPGNVRELLKVCDRLSQRQSGIIDAAYVHKVLPIASSEVSLSEGWEEFVFKNGLRSYIASLEKHAVEESLKRNKGKITACIKELKISSSAFYRILQENQLSL